MGERGAIDSDNMARFLNVLAAASTKMKEEDATETNIETIQNAYKVLLTQSERYDEKFLKKVKHVIDIIEDAFKIYEDGKKARAAHRLPKVRAAVAAKASHRRAAEKRLLRNRGTLRNLHRKLHGAHANSNSSGSSSHSSSSNNNNSSSGSHSSNNKTKKAKAKANGKHSRSRSNGASRHRMVTPKTSNNNE
jgi:hypothetical protein